MAISKKFMGDDFYNMIKGFIPKQERGFRCEVPIYDEWDKCLHHNQEFKDSLDALVYTAKCAFNSVYGLQEPGSRINKRFDTKRKRMIYELYFVNRDEAYRALKDIGTMLKRYGRVTFLDICDLMGVGTAYEYGSKIICKHLDGIRVTRNYMNGLWIIELPSIHGGR